MANSLGLTLSTRLTIIALDIAVYAFPFYIVSALCFYLFVDFNYAGDLNDIYSLFDSGFIYSLSAFFAGIIFYLNKDIQSGRSFAKKFYNVQIVDVETGKTASPIKCVFRNVTYVILPVELFFLVRNPERRLGDFIAGTQIKRFESIDKKVYSILDQIIAVIASISIYLIFAVL